LFKKKYRAKLIVNWLDKYSFNRVLDVFQRNKDWQENVRKKILAVPAFSQITLLLWKQLTHFIGDKSWGDVSKVELRKPSSELTAYEFIMQGEGQFKEELITCGGASLKRNEFQNDAKSCRGKFILRRRGAGY
jgi:predicted flavoprotein YhiN